jgi:5-formyltetrahydrofolate cyclo-ligase
MKAKKATLREDARRRRAAIFERQPNFAAEISRYAPEIAGTDEGVIAGYIPLEEEADPTLLMATLAAKGRTLALPCIAQRGAPLLFRKWEKGDALLANAFGILEPVPAAPAAVPSLVLVPLLAFDSRGHRLGYGGGYYDRTLDRLRRDGAVIAIGIAFAGQEVEELPRETHDHALDLIVTESGIRRF